jgi:hypothetical protein
VEGKERIKALRAASGFAAEDKPRPMLPTHLTPDAVREMLGRVRVDASRQRSAALDDARRERRAAANAGVTGASASATPGGWGVGEARSFAPTAATSIGGTAASRFAAHRAAAEKENESVGAAAAAAAAGAGAGAAGKGPPASWDSRGFEEPAGFGIGGEGVLSGAPAVSAFDPYGGGGAAAPAPEEPAGFGLGGEGFLLGARPSGASAGGW